MTKTENYAQTKHKNVNENGGKSVYNLTVAPFKCWLQNEQANIGSFLDLSIAEEVNVILLSSVILKIWVVLNMCT